MAHYYWNDWYSGWGWFLWFAVIVLIFSSFGNWGYTYRAQRNFGLQIRKEALDILNERYARGEVALDEYKEMKSEIAKAYSNGGDAGTHSGR
ncbi:SHOCT domain-containing protein [Paraburkholderia sp. BCC1876]|uniref:SHOCT domain-containing protein n=1 Tax=Paraburkholderia sp. BCC1876 TaxID=2676303 RepID=UPI0015922D4F|nr:SHOCT domain-containing protein [Paraburkholderia sp. BCC1876]